MKTGLIYLPADPSNRHCILGAGVTSDAAWAQVVEEHGPFWADEFGVGPYMIPAEEARKTQFVEFVATERLLTLVEEQGGVAWEIVDGVADVIMTADERSLADALELAAYEWASEREPRPDDLVEIVDLPNGRLAVKEWDAKPTRLMVLKNCKGWWDAWFDEDGGHIPHGAIIVSARGDVEHLYSDARHGRSLRVAQLAIEAWDGAEAEAAR